MAVQFEHRRLENGLTALGEVNAQAYTAAVGFFVKTGARDEPRAWMGVSHFLEHMVFKGTARRSPDDVNREFDEIGAEYNAFTGQETTVFYAQVLPEFVPRVLDLLADVMRPALRQQDFEMERQVILEEIRMYEDRPQWRLHDALMEAHFGKHPLAHRVLGTRATVAALTADQMRQYCHQRYAAGNLLFVAAGRLDFQAVAADLARLTAHWHGGSPTGRYSSDGPRPVELGLQDARLNRHYLGMMVPGPAAQDPRRYAAKVLAEVLGSADGSRLHWALVEPGLAEEAELSHYPFDHAGAYAAFATCDPSQATKVQTILKQTLCQAAAGLDDDEVERAKNKIATDAVIPAESPLGRLRDVGTNWIYLDQYLTLEQDIRQLMAVTLGDVRALAQELAAAPQTVVRLGPQ